MKTCDIEREKGTHQCHPRAMPPLPSSRICRIISADWLALAEFVTTETRSRPQRHCLGRGRLDIHWSAFRARLLFSFFFIFFALLSFSLQAWCFRYIAVHTSY